MRIGLDHLPLEPLLGLTPLQLVETAFRYGYEGVILTASSLLEDERLRYQIRERLQELNMYLELGGPQADPILSGKSIEEILVEWQAVFSIAKEIGANILITSLGTWPWESRTIREDGKTLYHQIKEGINVLTEIGKMAIDYSMTIAIHTSFFRADEYINIIEEVGLPSVRLCLDTANSFLVLEDPIEFARKVAPFVCSTHLKDTCIYLEENGMVWHGGCPLGRGIVNLLEIIDILYQQNPEINLTIEDHWGRMVVPVFNQEFMSTLGDRSGTEISKLLYSLFSGQILIKSGILPTAMEASQINWKEVFPERIKYNLIYAKKLRDQIKAKYH